MTDRNFGETEGGGVYWIGVVVDVNDPHKSGRATVRIIGRHDDKINIPDSALPWALPLQTVTSAAIGKIGSSPLGLVPGSRVMGFWLDSDHQYPVIMGSIGKSGDPITNQTENGAPKIDTTLGSISAGAQGSTPNNPYSTLNTNKQLLTDNIFSTPSNKGIVLTTEVKKGMSFETLPTTASASKKNKSNILSIIQSVDPTYSSSSLKCISISFLGIDDLVKIAAGVAGKLLGELKNLVIGAIQNAILNLAQKYGVFKVLGLLNSTANKIAEVANLINALNIQVCGKNLFNQGIFDSINGLVAETLNGINTITSTVTAGLMLPGAAVNNLFDNIALAPLASIATGTTQIPPKISILPPDNYVQQYYADSDPYPGYIVFADPNNLSSQAYVPRNGEPNYVSASQHIFFNAQQNIITGLEKAIISNTLTSSGLTDLFSNVASTSQAFAATKLLGQGFSAVGAIAGLAVGAAVGAAKSGVALIDLSIDTGITVVPQSSILNPIKESVALSKFTLRQQLINIQRTKANIGVGGF